MGLAALTKVRVLGCGEFFSFIGSNMIKTGKFYMHDKSLDTCVLVHESLGDGQYSVQWHNLGYVGTPWAIEPYLQQIYMHPDVWTDVTDKLTIPRTQWGS
jgi:hypothetical protein